MGSVKAQAKNALHEHFVLQELTTYRNNHLNWYFDHSAKTEESPEFLSASFGVT